MKRLILPAGAVVALAGTLSGQALPDSALAAQIRTAAAESGVPGGAVVLVRPEQGPLIVMVGAADRAGRAITDSTGFRVGSVSKVLTAATVARLVADGRLSLDEDIRSRAPWISEAAGPEPITLRQLLTHTSGLDDYAVGMFARAPSDVQPLGVYLGHRMPARTTEPGRWTRYSNHGAAVAGWVAADAWGADFAATVHQVLLGPLGMDDSGFEQPIPGVRLHRLALAFPCPDRECEPRPLDYRHAPPAGGFITTPGDMARFMEAVLAPDSSGLGEAAHLLTSRAWGFRPELPGLALALQEQPIGHWRGLVHAGTGSGYMALIALVPETRSAMFAVTTGGSAAFGRQAMRLLAELQPPRVDDPVTPAPVMATERAALEGAYILGRASRSTCESFPELFLYSQTFGFDDDGWLVRREGGRVVRYGRLDGDLFGEVGGTGRLAFERNGSGRVVAVHAADEFFGIRYPASWIRLPWWSRPGFMNEFMSAVVGVPVLALVGWTLITGAAAALRRGRRKGAAIRPVSWSALAVSLLATLTMLVVAFGFMARFNALAANDPQALALGMPEELQGRLRYVWPAAALAVLSAFFAARCWMAWRRARWLDLIVITTISACTALFLALMIHFHVLPPTG